MEISKALLSEVFEKEVESYSLKKDNEITISFYADENNYKTMYKVLEGNGKGMQDTGRRIYSDLLSINIYELASKYKEFAYDNGMILKSWKANGCWLSEMDYEGVTDSTSTLSADTEPEVIINSVQWWYENKFLSA